MNTLGKFVIIGAVLAASPVLAQGRGNGNGNAGVNVGAGIGAQGTINGNGVNAEERTFGAARAEGRAAEAQARTNTQGRSELGGLNAARASENAQANANANSRVGEIATYESRMRTAMAITDTTRRNAAITDARRQLAQTSNKPLTADAITQLDSELNIQGASPRLGAQ
jgi:hypothetical protein